MFGVIFNKTANNVGITVEYIDQKTLQLPQFIQLNLSENLSKIRQRLNDRGIINSTLSFVRKYDGNSRFAEIAFEEEENISLNEIVRKSEDARILSLTTCSKFNWKVLNQLRKLDYGCTMTSDGIKKADKRAFEMKDCIFEEIGNEECKAGEFNSSSYIGNWVGSLNNYRCWYCIEFRNPISIFQFLPNDLHERIIKSVGITIHHSTIETCDLVLEEYKKPIQFRLEIPTDIKKIIKNKDVDCKILATVTDITESKNDFFTCQVLFPSDGRLPSLIIHRVQNPFKLFKKRECKLHIGWMVIGYYRDFNFDFNTRLKVQKNDFNAPANTDNLIEYDSKVPICLGTPVLSEYPSKIC
ncbi:hypothetical protein RhiirA1_440564 [Rhizophagus irregularis]|uniref:DUF7431 domain-containing protein n=1 Tax=Rhizophagus irregularis TaxID=588596 RepID=A0A2N0RZ29_9GLOM|nr:hypothetical protein RhiirA1_440564 [Rhizophagus irregularis]